LRLLARFRLWLRLILVLVLVLFGGPRLVGIFMRDRFILIVHSRGGHRHGRLSRRRRGRRRRRITARRWR